MIQVDFKRKLVMRNKPNTTEYKIGQLLAEILQFEHLNFRAFVFGTEIVSHGASN